MTTPLMIVACALAAVAGCRGASDPPPCAAVAGNFVLIATTQLAAARDLDDDTRHAVRDQLPAMRDSIDRACSDTRWSAEVRRCLARAVDHVAFGACQDQLTEEQRRALDRSARGGRDPR